MTIPEQSRPRRVWLQQLLALLQKDLLFELRSRQVTYGMLIFALLVILIFNFALELEIRTRAELTSGILWVTFIFAGSLGINRTMALEMENACIDGLLLAPVSRSVIFCAKAAGNLLFMLLVALIILPVYSLLYNVPLFHPGLLLVIVLGTLGYSSIGTILSSMSMHSHARGLLLPILTFPLCLPIIIAAVKAGTGYLQGWPAHDIQPWLNLLIGYDVIFTTVAFMLYEYILEE